MIKIFQDILIMIVVAATAWFVYTTYGDEVRTFLFNEPAPIVYIDDLAITVTIADEPDEWQRGLSGVTELSEREGKLFIFDEEDFYSIWMRGMLIPIDIVWINNEFEIVHIEERVDPDTFPESFVPDEPARFVLEVNAFFTESYKISEGDVLTLPPNIIPKDIIPEA